MRNDTRDNSNNNNNNNFDNNETTLIDFTAQRNW